MRFILNYLNKNVINNLTLIRFKSIVIRQGSMIHSKLRIRKKFFIPNFYNMQFLTNHGNFNAYLLRIKKIDNPLCDCNIEDQTSIHLLTSCLNLDKQTFPEHKNIFK